MPKHLVICKTETEVVAAAVEVAVAEAPVAEAPEVANATDAGVKVDEAPAAEAEATPEA